MSGRAAAVRNRVVVAALALALAWLFGWTSTEAVVMVVVALAAVLLAVTRGLFGGLGVLVHWLTRYRGTGIGLRELGDIIGEHRDDMRRAGLVVAQPLPRRWRRTRRPPRQRPDLVPRLRHRPYEDGVVVSLEAVRAGMSQQDILRAVPRLRSAWGVHVVEVEARPGGRVVDFWIPMTEEARRARPGEYEDADHELRDLAPRSPRRADERDDRGRDQSPRRSRWDDDDSGPIRVVAGEGPRTGTLPTADRRPPTIAPGLQPDDRGRYELTMLPADAARTFSPRTTEGTEQEILERADDVDEQRPRTDEIPVIEAPSSIPAREPARPQPSRRPQRGGGERRNPTDVDERDLRLGAHWRTGREK